MATITESTASVTDLLDVAGSLVTDDMDAPMLSCSWCGLEQQTFANALERDAYTRVVWRFLEHVAFDHSGRADILVHAIVRRISFTD